MIKRYYKRQYLSKSLGKLQKKRLFIWIAVFQVMFVHGVNAEEAKLETIHVYGGDSEAKVNFKGEPIVSHSGTQEISPEMVEDMPKGNGNMTELLRTLPEVKYTDPSLNAETAGEIKPGEVSINGGRTYQNNFIIDGSPNNSLIDPNSKMVDSFGNLPGHPQEMFLDTQLLESVTVYSSNVSAQYGQFSGGVVKAKTKRAKGVSQGYLRLRHTSDNWTEFYTDQKTGTSYSAKPKFDKWQYGFFFNQPINADSAFYVNLQRQQSDIPVIHLDSTYNEQRQLDNWLIKNSNTLSDGTLLDISLSYAPYQEKRISEDVKDSAYTLNGGGGKVNVEMEKDLLGGILSSTFSVNKSESSRKAGNEFYTWATTSSHDWGRYTQTPDVSKEGGKGELKQEQTNIFLKNDYLSQAFNFLGSESVFTTGLELKQVGAMKNRPEDAHEYHVSMTDDDKPESGLSRLRCNGVDACIEAEQYAAYQNVYLEGKRQAEILNLGTYFENTFDYQRWLLRLGLRYDYNNYMQNQDVAYRSFTKLDVLNDQTFFLTGGLNRYYANTFLTYKLQQSGNDYQQYSRGLEPYTDVYGNKTFTPTEWRIGAGRNLNIYNYSELETPYTDEATFGFEWRLFSGIFSVERLLREGNNEFASSNSTVQKDGYAYREQTNDGWSRFDSWQASWERNWQHHQLVLSYFSANGKTSHLNYADSVSTEATSTKVFYGGQLMELSDTPSIDVQYPDQVKLVYSYSPDSHWNLGAFGQWSSSYSVLEATGDVVYFTQPNESGTETILVSAPEFDEVTYEANFTMDLSVSYRQKIYKGYVQATLDVMNVFNHIQKIEGVANEYRIGRQFWLGLQAGW